MATTTACAPKLRPIASINVGSFSAAEFTLTLSAPASNTCAASSAVRMPPPTQKGTNSSRAVRRTVSSSVARPSCVAVMSSSTISSAPSRAWRAACVAGSPASTRSTNCTPFTTRPPCTSRQAMMRLVIIPSPSLPTRENCEESSTPSRRISPDETARPSHCRARQPRQMAQCTA